MCTSVCLMRPAQKLAIQQSKARLINSYDTDLPTLLYMTVFLSSVAKNIEPRFPCSPLNRCQELSYYQPDRVFGITHAILYIWTIWMRNCTYSYRLPMDTSITNMYSLVANKTCFVVNIFTHAAQPRNRVQARTEPRTMYYLGISDLSTPQYQFYSLLSFLSLQQNP